MPHKADNQPKRKRRWLRFSVRWLLLLATLVCIWLGFVVKRANDQRKAVQFVKELGVTPSNKLFVI